MFELSELKITYKGEKIILKNLLTYLVNCLYHQFYCIQKHKKSSSSVNRQFYLLKLFDFTDDFNVETGPYDLAYNKLCD